jgi:hypothetical protein
MFPPPPPPEITGSVRMFLDKTIPGLSDDPEEAAFWKGTKYLGERAFCMVGLWKYKNPDPNAKGPANQQIVMKKIKWGKDIYQCDLAPEATHHVAILQGGTNHIVDRSCTRMPL